MTVLTYEVRSSFGCGGDLHCELRSAFFLSLSICHLCDLPFLQGRVKSTSTCTEHTVSDRKIQIQLCGRTGRRSEFVCTNFIKSFAIGTINLRD